MYFFLYISNFYSSSMLSNVATEISSCLFSLPVYLRILLRSFLGFSSSLFHQRFTSFGGRKRTRSIIFITLQTHFTLHRWQKYGQANRTHLSLFRGAHRETQVPHLQRSPSFTPDLYKLNNSFRAVMALHLQPPEHGIQSASSLGVWTPETEPKKWDFSPAHCAENKNRPVVNPGPSQLQLYWDVPTSPQPSSQLHCIHTHSLLFQIRMLQQYHRVQILHIFPEPVTAYQ